MRYNARVTRFSRECYKIREIRSLFPLLFRIFLGIFFASHIRVGGAQLEKTTGAPLAEIPGMKEQRAHTVQKLAGLGVRIQKSIRQV